MIGSFIIMLFFLHSLIRVLELAKRKCMKSKNYCLIDFVVIIDGRYFRWLFEILRELDQERLQAFCRFTTGSSKLFFTIENGQSIGSRDIDVHFLR